MRKIEINKKILDQLKNASKDENEYSFFVEVISNCVESVGYTIPKELEKDLSIILDNRFIIPNGEK